jgi:hypothetical protein
MAHKKSPVGKEPVRETCLVKKLEIAITRFQLKDFHVWIFG